MKKFTYEEIAAERFSAEQLKHLERFPVYAICENVRSAFNVGSMFRTADGARMAKLYLTGYTPFPPHKDIEKTALGSTQTVPWEYAKNSSAIIDTLKSKGITICAVEHTDKSIPHYDFSPALFPVCFIVGNEISGVMEESIAKADCAIEIPMYGVKQSLNAANAFSIVAFEMIEILLRNKK
ncbi:MAG: RNA methyltransferase [Bacteroidota bacterium]